MLDKSYYQRRTKSLAIMAASQSALIPIMQDIQAGHRYLPGELLTMWQRNWGERSQSLQCCHIYENFSFEPKGKYIKVCDGTACHVHQNPCPFWKPSKRAAKYKGTQTRKCFLLWRLFPAWVPVPAGAGSYTHREQ